MAGQFKRVPSTIVRYTNNVNSISNVSKGKTTKVMFKSLVFSVLFTLLSFASSDVLSECWVFQYTYTTEGTPKTAFSTICYPGWLDSQEGLDYKNYSDRQTQIAPGMETAQQTASRTEAAQHSQQNQVGDCPVIYDTGQKELNEVDYVGTGEMPLAVTKRYGSGDNSGEAGIFGVRWSSSFDIKLRINYTDGAYCTTSINGAVTPFCNGTYPDNFYEPRTVESVTLVHGIEENFVNNPWGALRPSSSVYSRRNITGIWVPPDQYGNYITGWIYEDEDGTRYEFNQFGRLLSKTTINGISWTFTYDNDAALSRVTHSSGRELIFNWSGSTYVSSIQLPNGKTIQYDYQTSPTYEFSVVYPDNTGTKTYKYQDDRHSPIVSIDIDGQAWGDYAYKTNQVQVDYSGMVNGINRSTYSYTDSTTVETNAKGGKKTMAYDENRRLIRVDKDATEICPASFSTTAYRSGGNSSKVDFKVDESGVRTSYTYNSNDDIELEYANGITKEYFWDSKGRLIKLNVWDGAKDPAMCAPGQACPTPRLEPARVTEYIYNPAYNNRLQYKKEKALRYDSTLYTPTITYTYGYEFHPNKLIKKVYIDGPLAGNADVTVKEYNTKGDLTGISYPNGTAISYLHETNNSGLISQFTDANGLVTGFKYDAKGRLTQTTINDGTPKITKYEYYGDNELKKVTYPNAGYLKYGLDSARRVNSITRPDELYAARKTVLTHDLLNNVETTKTHFVDSQDQVLSTITSVDNVYDKNGNLKQSKGQNGSSISFTYYANGNIKTATDALNRVSRFTYNAANQLETATNPKNEIVTYHYDSMGYQSEVIDGNGHSTFYHRNGFGMIEEMISPDTGLTAYEYNDQGQIETVTKANDVSITYTYDILGRKETATTAGSWRDVTVEYFYDTTAPGSTLSCTNGKGRLCGFTDSSGSTNYSYTLSGQISKKQQVTNGVTYLMSYSYDSYGRLYSTAYPNGVILRNYYDINNRVKEIHAYVNGVWSSVVSRKDYAKPSHITTYSEHTELTYDKTNNKDIVRKTFRKEDGRLLSIRAEYDFGSQYSKQYQELLYTYKPDTPLIVDIVNQITPSQNINQSLNPPHNNSFTYDELNRLKTALNGTSQAFEYSFDNNGNRVTQKDPNNPYYPSTNYTYYAGNNRLATRVQAGGGNAYTYDGAGNVVAKASGAFSGGTMVYISSRQIMGYDGFGNMAYHGIDGGVPKLQYFYNALNQRVHKFRQGSSAGGEPMNNVFLYSPDGLLAAESDRRASAISTVYVYLEGEIVGVVRNNKVFTVHNDHLGRPELVTDPEGNIVFRAKNNDFGRQVFYVETGWSGEFGGSIGFNGTDNGFNIGFPGQYYDSESGLWYNGHRYYDQDTGRYLQSDPLGLIGGMNTYAYANNNPISYVDPFGLAPCNQAGQSNGIVAEGTATLVTGGEATASGQRMLLQLKVYNEDRTMSTDFEITATALVGGYEAGAPVSFTRFTVLLEGPSLGSIEPYSLRSAFDGAVLNYSSFTFSVGAGISVGNLTIGNYSEPRSVIGVGGFDVGWTGFKGIAHVGNNFTQRHYSP
jgi:RHS repeat-associated protein